LQNQAKAFRKKNIAVLLTFALVDKDFTLFEVDVTDPDFDQFADPHSVACVLRGQFLKRKNCYSTWGHFTKSIFPVSCADPYFWHLTFPRTRSSLIRAELRALFIVFLLMLSKRPTWR
jgi:hypothetical protein